MPPAEREGATAGLGILTFPGVLIARRAWLCAGISRLEQGHRLRAAGLAEVVQRQPGPLARVHRRAALQVGQREVALAVAAVGRAEQREERRVLGERQAAARRTTPSPWARS